MPKKVGSGELGGVDQEAFTCGKSGYDLREGGDGGSGFISLDILMWKSGLAAGKREIK